MGAYEHVARSIAEQRCVILDGGVGTELSHSAQGQGRARRAAVGHAGADREPRRGAARAPRVRPGRLRRHLDQHLGPGLGGGDRRPAPVVGPRHARALDGRRAPRAAARPPGGARARARRRVRGRLLPQRRRRLRRGGRDDQAPRAPVRRRGRAARPRPARDPVAAHAHARRRDRGPAGHRPAGVAVLPALPPRAVRHLRPALGRPRGRRLRARRAALRGDGRGRAAHQLHPARPRRGDGLLPARLHRPAARRLSEPRLLQRSRLALHARRRRRGVRRDGAALARGGRADRRRLLRRAPRAHRRRRAAPARHGARPRATDRRRPQRPQRRGGPAPAAAARAVDRPPPAPAVPAALPRPQRRAGRGAPGRRQLHGLALRLRRGHRRPPALPGHRLRHRHPRRPARPQRRRPRARARHRRPRGGQHAGQRLPQRRRRPRHRADRRPLPVGARGALRGHRREPLPEAHRSLRARLEPSPARLLGAQPRRPADRQALRGAGARGRRLHRPALDPLPAPHGRRPRRPRLRRRRRSTTRCSPSRPSRRRAARRSPASRSSATPTT